jgi:hypothetical protein
LCGREPWLRTPPDEAVPGNDKFDDGEDVEIADVEKKGASTEHVERAPPNAVLE